MLDAAVLRPGGPLRRIALVAATVLTVAATLALRMHVAHDQARPFYPPERITAASHGQPADYQGFRWWLGTGRQERRVFLPHRITHVTLTLRMQALTAAAAAATGVNDPRVKFEFAFRDPRTGAVWPGGRPQGTQPYQVGAPVERVIEGDLPEAVAGRVGLQVRVPWFTKLGSETKQHPRTSDPVLQLAR
ncbi:MAG TPA: hypothetical protein VH912_32980 [Streptosporangiaceae bacterium]|jgi:hypothetical protein